MKFSIKDFFSKCDQIRNYLISDLLAFLVMMLFSSFCCFSVSEKDTSRKLHDYEDIHEEFFFISLKKFLSIFTWNFLNPYLNGYLEVTLVKKV